MFTIEVIRKTTDYIQFGTCDWIYLHFHASGTRLRKAAPHSIYSQMEIWRPVLSDAGLSEPVLSEPVLSEPVLSDTGHQNIFSVGNIS